MLSLKLDYNEALELLGRAVQEKGAEYFYEIGDTHSCGCVYFRDNKPACIVGHVLAYKGVKPEDLRPEENEANVSALGIGEDYRATALLDWAQAYQDRGVTWGEAVAKAIEQANSAHEDDYMEFDEDDD